jgi:hypothetical protein
VPFWEIIGFILISFVFIAYLLILFSIFADLIADDATKGWIKALWVLSLIILPVLSALVYLIIHGTAMAGRAARRASKEKSAADGYIRHVATSSSPAEQISQAKSLLDAGTITQEEFAALKAKAIA